MTVLSCCCEAPLIHSSASGPTGRTVKPFAFIDTLECASLREELKKSHVAWR